MSYLSGFRVPFATGLARGRRQGLEISVVDGLSLFSLPTYSSPLSDPGSWPALEDDAWAREPWFLPLWLVTDRDPFRRVTLVLIFARLF
jgi:hypothetical protein